MDERLKTIIAEELMFAKEAAAYLGISVQRLNKLMHKGKIQPVKRSPPTFRHRQIYTAAKPPPQPRTPNPEP